MPDNAILTIREVRREREKLQDAVRDLIKDFERRANGVKVAGVSINRGVEKDRRGMRFERLGLSIVAQIKDGTGAEEL